MSRCPWRSGSWTSGSLSRDWASQVDVLALAEEVEALRAEVDRLHAHGG
ncbi:hypothetical protein [Actinokineospora alba]|nr:hypothetical protein [Actinokineospora alba]